MRKEDYFTAHSDTTHTHTARTDGEVWAHQCWLLGALLYTCVMLGGLSPSLSPSPLQLKAVRLWVGWRWIHIKFLSHLKYMHAHTLCVCVCVCVCVRKGHWWSRSLLMRILSIPNLMSVIIKHTLLLCCKKTIHWGVMFLDKNFWVNTLSRWEHSFIRCLLCTRFRAKCFISCFFIWLSQPP